MIRFLIDINDTFRALSNQYAFYYAKAGIRKRFNINKLLYKEQDFYSPFRFDNEKQKLKFQVEDYPFEIYGCAKPVERELPGIVNTWLSDLEDYVNKDGFEIAYVAPGEYYLQIQSTLFFLSKTSTRVRKILFPKTSSEVWDEADILLTANPILLNKKPADKTVIKITQPYNSNYETPYTYNNLKEFIDDKNTWEKLFLFDNQELILNNI